MSRRLDTSVLEQLLEPVSESLNREAAEKLVRMKVNAKTQGYIDRLGRKCNEGRLTEAERAEYETCVAAIDFIAILQAQARRLLGKTTTA